MSIAKDPAFRRALQRYAEAIENKAFEGTIPYVGSTPAEQAELDAMHEAINDELNRAKVLLVALIDRRIASNRRD